MTSAAQHAPAVHRRVHARGAGHFLRGVLIGLAVIGFVWLVVA